MDLYLVNNIGVERNLFEDFEDRNYVVCFSTWTWLRCLVLAASVAFSIQFLPLYSFP